MNKIIFFPLASNTSYMFNCSGYMSPEYAVLGKFSIKSDVFSFGVVLLEIVSGKRNSESYEEADSLSLLGQMIPKYLCLTLLFYFIYLLVHPLITKCLGLESLERRRSIGDSGFIHGIIRV